MITPSAVKDYYTLHVPGAEQYFANGILHHNSGKTLLLLRAVLVRALKSPGSRHAVFRFTFSSIKASIIYDTLPKILEICFPGLAPHTNLNKTDWFLKLANGSEIWFAGLDDKERTEKILGQEFATLYFNECSQIPWHSVLLATTRLAQKATGLKLKAYYDFNPPSKKHWTYLRFVEKKDPVTRMAVENPHNYGFYLINPGDNMANLSEEYISILRSLPEKQRNRFLLGKFADDDEGALWSEQVLASTRRAGANTDVPEFMRIVIAVDPSGCKGPEDTRSDEVGIVVAALGTDSHAYVIEDLSGKYSPEQWGNVAAEAFNRHHADVIVGEVNYGGDMVRAIIQAQNAEVPYKEVRASRGKVVRAEPVSHLYEQNKVHHVGIFPELEDQLLGMTQSGYMGIKSPDRADACLIATTDVTTARGDVELQHITTGDKVLTREGYYPVSWAGMTKGSAEVYTVEFSDGTTIVATAEHPILVINSPVTGLGGWTRVDELTFGNEIVCHDPYRIGRPEEVFVISATANEERVPVYNLHVDGPHEFYANGILVHNCIWAIHELFPSITRKVDDTTLNCKVIAPQRSASRFGRNANNFNRTRY